MVSFNSTIFFTISSFCYILLLFIVFFGKKKVKNRDNKIYSVIICITLVEVIAELLLCMFASFSENKFYVYINKFYLICLLSWSFTFLFYILNISDKYSIKNIYNKFKNILFSVYLVFALLIIVTETKFCTRDGIVMYSFGTSINILYVAVSICILVMFAILIVNYKNIRDKKYIPIYVFLTMGIITTIIQNMYPFLLLTTSVETFITVLMYHTIENPDIKVIEEVRDAKIVADNANSEKSIFLYNMTQEIRNTVNDINKNVGNIVDSNNLEDIHQYARGIYTYTSKFTTMTNEILDTSNLEKKSIKVYNDKYDIKLLLKELVKMYKEKYNNKGIDFRVNFDNNLPRYLYGDSLNMKNALITVLDNSYKHTKQGYVEFNVDTIIKNNICRLIITIEDSGTGMRAVKLEEALNKKEDDINNKTLSNAKRIINLIGGTLIVSSDYGKGTKVTAIIDQKMEENDSKTIVATYQKKYINKKILVVDDSEAGLKIINKIFNNIEIDYDEVKSGKECLNKIRNNEKYDLILLDGEMDYMDGKTVMKKLKEIKGFNTKVILVTSNNMQEYDDSYLKYGFTDYIIKPLTKDSINKIINKYL